MGDDTYQVSRRRRDSNLDLSHIARTTRPSSLASGPGSGPGSLCRDPGDAPTIVSMSVNRPRHPAFWRFTGVGVDGGDFSGFGACARTFSTKIVSCRARIANACCSAPGNAGVDVVVAKREAGEDVDVREVVVPCERMEEQSETEVTAEGGHEPGRGVYECEVATVAAEGRMGGGGGTRRVLLREREELLAEGVCVRTGELTPEDVVQPCEAKLPTELRGWETGRWAAWADALKAAVAVTTAWSPKRARAFRVAVAFGDEAGGQCGGRRRAQRHFRRTRLGFRRLLFLSP